MGVVAVMVVVLVLGIAFYILLGRSANSPLQGCHCNCIGGVGIWYGFRPFVKASKTKQGPKRHKPWPLQKF